MRACPSVTVRASIETAAAVIESYNIRTTVYTSDQPEPEAREVCILSMVDDIRRGTIGLLTIEIDESFRERDRELIHPLLARLTQSLTWRHGTAFSEPCLWIPDAIGWCMNHPERRWRNAVTDLPISRVGLS